MTPSLLGGVDWGIVGLFLGLVLLEGLRRVPAGALTVRAIGWGGWRPVGGSVSDPRWRLVSWWPPVTQALVLPPLDGRAALPPDELASRLVVARRAAPWLAAGGVSTTAALVLGVPVATGHFGTIGFLAGAAVALALAVMTALAGALALRRLGPARSVPRSPVLGWCSPFAGGRVLEGVYEAALAGASPAQALRALSGDATFSAWARPRAYDVVRGGVPDADLAAAADPKTLESIIAVAPPMEPAALSYCPRCAATWSVVRDSCADCAVPLVGRLAAGA